MIIISFIKVCATHAAENATGSAFFCFESELLRDQLSYVVELAAVKSRKRLVRDVMQSY